MKSTIKETKSESAEIVYPCLMRNLNNGNQIVLFLSERCGTQVTPDMVGFCHRDDWFLASDKKKWQPFTGTVTLEN